MDVAGLGARMEELSGGSGGRTWCYDYDVFDEPYFVDDCMMGMSPNVIVTTYDCMFTIWWFAHVCLRNLIILLNIVERLNFGVH